MSEDIKNNEDLQPISDEELDEASGGFCPGIVTRLPHTSTDRSKASKLPYSGEKPKVVLL